jgi:hypothetical protein
VSRAPFVSFALMATLSVHLNEADFPEPQEFRPERFLDKRDYPGTWGHSAFGWGRRICPGMHLGSASVSINIARILWAFEVKPAKNEKGEDIDVDMYEKPDEEAPTVLLTPLHSFAFSDGFNSSPLPFQCSISPRSPRHTKVVEKEYREAMEQLKVYTADSNSIS